jgi:ATP-dependent exoDNAse (exonuclease V) beta subunit
VSALHHRLILASAGTGKTYQLTGQFLGLLFDGVPPERILATTFTRKAAGEILDRVLERLVEGATSDEHRAALGDALGRDDVTAERCRELLAHLTRNLDTFQVRTIDSFFVHVVRLFALDLELPPSWGIASARRDEALRSEAMQDVLRDGQDAELLELLRELHDGGASRGVHQAMLDRAGKLRPVFLESAGDAWGGVDPGARPSDAELEAAVRALQAAELPTTAKGAPNKVWANARTSLLERAAEEDWVELLSKGLGAKVLAGAAKFSRHPISDEVRAAIEPIVRRAAHAWLSALRERNLATLSLLERFERAYDQRKRAAGAYRFDDLPQALAPRAAGERPLDARELDLWFRLDGRIDHLLLDEFQDTSPVQWRVLENIASELAADGTGERTFFCVGDVKQSIYGFRQAEPRLLAELPEMLPGLEPETMETSHRSSRVVLETVNHVFGALERNAAIAGDDLAPHREAARRWQRGFPAHVAAKDLPGAAFVVEARPRDADAGEKVEATLLERAVERTVELCTQSPVATVGVLMRERKHIALLIHRLRRHGIDASGEGGNELTDSEAVLAFLALLHLADHPADRAAAFHVASSRFGAYVGLAPDAADDAIREIARELRARLAAEGLGAVCAAFARRVSADEEWSAWDRTRFAQLADLAFAFEAEAGLRSSDFVDHVRTERVEAPGGARVRVMTIHGSKGLEFDAVVLPELHKKLVGARSGLLVDRPRAAGLIETVSLSPGQKLLAVHPRLAELYDQTTARMFEDGLCNLYVALTRAKRRLDLVVPWVDPDASSSSPSAADFVRAALPPSEVHEPDAAGVVWSHPAGSSGDAWAAGLAEEGDDAPPAPAVESLGLAPSTRLRNLPRRSPSAAGGAGVVRAGALFADRGGARRGTLLHRWLEELEWLEGFDLDEEHALAIGAELEPDEDARRAALADLRAALDAEEIRDALSRAGCRAPDGVELEVRNELSFSVVLPDAGDGDQLWTGSIDRLVVARRGDQVVWAEVLDHKTGRPDADELAERIEHYRAQLASYARVVAAQTGLDAEAIPLRLVFLDLGRVVDLR